MTTTVKDLIAQIAQMVQEDPAFVGSPFWGTDEIMRYINEITKEFVLKTQLFKTPDGVQAIPGQRVYTTSTFASQMDRIAFNNIALDRTTKFALDHGNIRWRVLSGIPKQYHQADLCELPPSDLSITSSCPSPQPVIGVAFFFAPAVYGGIPPYTWSISSGYLPPGLSLNPSTGVISGTPTTAGTYPWTLQVIDGAGNVQTLSCTSTPFGIISSCPTDQPVIGAPYSYTFEAAGGTLPYTWSIISGVLPDGLTLDPDTGEISGTPTESGTFPYTIQATDSSVPQQTSTIDCTFEISPTDYEVATGLQFLISEDQDDTYIYAGTNGFYVPANVLRFLKSTGELVDTIDMPVQGTDSVCDLKSDDVYLYARYSYSALSVVRIRKSDFTVVDSLTFAPKTANAFPSLGQMWVDQDEQKLYVPAENTAAGFAAVWRIDLTDFSDDGSLNLTATPPTTTTTGNGIAGAITGDATDLYVSTSNQGNSDLFSALLYPAVLSKINKATFTVTATCFYPGIFSIEASMYPQIAADATHVYGFGPRTDFADTGPVLYKFPKADITMVTHVDLGSYTNSSYVDCLYIDAGFLYFQDDVNNDLTTLLLSDFVTTAVVRHFDEQCSMFVFDADAYFEFMNGLAPDYSTLFRFIKT